MDVEEQVPVNVCSFEGAIRCDYFKGEPVTMAEKKIKVKKYEKLKSLGV